MENKTVYMVFKENSTLKKVEYEIIDSSDSGAVVLKLKSPVQTNYLFKEYNIVDKSAILEELSASTAIYLDNNYMLDHAKSYIEQHKFYPIEYIYTYKLSSQATIATREEC